MGKSGYVIITTPNLIVKVSVSPEQEGEGVPPSEGAALLLYLQIETFLNILCIYVFRGSSISRAALLLHLAAVLQRRLGLLEVRQDLLGVL